MPKKKVLIAGSAGRMAGLLIPALSETYELTGVDMRPTTAIPTLVADLRDPESAIEAFRGVDAVIDFANDPSFRASWQQVLQVNIATTYGTLLAAQRAGVKRYIFTSSNHASEMYEREPPYSLIAEGKYDGIDAATFPRITSTMPQRPDSPFGVGKVASEAAARYFADAFGMSNICLRLGTAYQVKGPMPTRIREFQSLITLRDLVHLYERVIEAPLDLKYAIYYGVSNNKWRIWDTSDARDQIGFRPQDNTEDQRAAFEAEHRG